MIPHQQSAICSHTGDVRIHSRVAGCEKMPPLPLRPDAATPQPLGFGFGVKCQLCGVLSGDGMSIQTTLFMSRSLDSPPTEPLRP